MKAETWQFIQILGRAPLTWVQFSKTLPYFYNDKGSDSVLIDKKLCRYGQGALSEEIA